MSGLELGVFYVLILRNQGNEYEWKYEISMGSE